MQFRTIAILMVALAMTGCANLPAVGSFSTNTIELADSVDRIAQDTSASCLRRLALDVPIKGIGDDKRQQYADACSQLKQSSDLFIELNATTRAYGRVLGQLADNKLVSFDSEVDSVKGAISKIRNGASPYYGPAQLNAVGSLADVVLRAATDAYRQREIRRMLDHHEDLVQLASVLSAFITRGYLPVLSNEAGNLDSLEEILNDRFISTKLEPLRARELLELLRQQRANLAERKKAAGDALNAIARMVEVHSQLVQNADKLDDKTLIELVRDYGRRIRDVRKQIQSSF